MMKEFVVEFGVEGKYEVTIPEHLNNPDEIKDYAIDMFYEEDFGELSEIDCDTVNIDKVNGFAVLRVTGYYGTPITLDENCSKEEIKEAALKVFNEEDFGALEDIDCGPLNYSSDEGEYEL